MTNSPVRFQVHPLHKAERAVQIAAYLRRSQLTHYRVYKTSVEGEKLPGPTLILRADSDDEAFVSALALISDSHGAEVWSRGRLICRMPHVRPVLKSSALVAHTAKQLHDIPNIDVASREKGGEYFPRLRRAML